MKKFIAILMAAAIAASMAACAKDDGGKDSDSSGDSKQEDTVKIADSLELLETVWMMKNFPLPAVICRKKT